MAHTISSALKICFFEEYADLFIFTSWTAVVRTLEAGLHISFVYDEY